MSGSEGSLGLDLERLDLEVDPVDLEGVILVEAFLVPGFGDLVAIMNTYFKVKIWVVRRP
jgi:hypothetical protein